MSEKPLEFAWLGSFEWNSTREEISRIFNTLWFPFIKSFSYFANAADYWFAPFAAEPPRPFHREDTLPRWKARRTMITRREDRITRATDCPSAKIMIALYHGYAFRANPFVGSPLLSPRYYLQRCDATCRAVLSFLCTCCAGRACRRSIATK